MRPILLALLLFSTLVGVSSAAIPGPIIDYFVWSKTVYVVRVTSVDKDKVNFVVTDTLRGDSVERLSLTPAWGFDAKPNTEWLLVACDKGWQDKDSVGWLMAGYCGWIPAPIVRDGPERYVQTMRWIDGVGMEKPDKVFSDHQSGYSIEHIKKLLIEHPDENKQPAVAPH